MAVDVRSQYALQPRSLYDGYGSYSGAFGRGPEATVGDPRGGGEGRDHDVSPSLAFQLCGGDALGCNAVETYISEQFKRVYGARLRHFMPWLLSYGNANGIAGALGLRRAECAPLFLEQYLDLPVEAVLAEKAGVPVNRADIVEIGNLVATARGGSRLLFLMLAELCAAADLTWAIFTATPEVQHLLQKLTDNQLVLCRADGARLGAELADWGTYYNTRPAVVAINVRGERERSLARPRISELLEVCRPQATAFAQQLVEAGL